MIGYAIHHSVFSAECQMNASITLQPLICSQGMQFLNFTNTADERWQEVHAWLIGHCGASVETTVRILFISLSC